MNKYIKISVVLINVLGVLILPRCVFAQPASLEDLLKEAIDHNPRVQAAYQQWQAAEHKVAIVKSLPDPMASYGYFGESVETRVGPQKQKFGLSQKVPFPGKLGLQAKAQTKRAEMMKEKYEAAKQDIIKNVKFVYYDLFWVDKAVQITKEEKAILENLEQVARKKYEIDLAAQQDALKAQVELTKLTNKLYLLGQNRESLAAKMNSLLNRDKDTPIGTVSDVDPALFNTPLEDLLKTAKASRQELKASRLAVEKAKYETSLARMDSLPDFTVGMDYIDTGSGTTTRSDDGKDAWMAMVSVNLPFWFNKKVSEVKEKKAELAAANSSAVDMENEVVYEVKDLYFKIMTYQDTISLYKNALIPQSDQAFDAARLGYESGKVDFLNWLDAERNTLQTRLAYYQSITDYLKSVAYLQRVVGHDLPAAVEDKGGRQ